MADKRCISKSISGSEKFSSNISDRARVLYLMTLAHTDDFGLFYGKPFDLRTYVVPNLNWSNEQVEICRDELVSCGLWNYWQSPDGQEVIEITNFEKHQTGLHKRVRAKFPDSSGQFRTVKECSGKTREVPGSSGKRREILGEQEQEQEQEENGTEQKKDLNTFCPEPAAPEPDQPKEPKIEYDFVNKYFINISTDQYNLWKQAYPAVDVKNEILRAGCWLDANPAKRKKNYKAFLMKWLARSQERGGGGPSNPIATGPRPISETRRIEDLIR